MIWRHKCKSQSRAPKNHLLGTKAPKSKAHAVLISIQSLKFRDKSKKNTPQEVLKEKFYKLLTKAKASHASFKTRQLCTQSHHMILTTDITKQGIWLPRNLLNNHTFSINNLLHQKMWVRCWCSSSKRRCLLETVLTSIQPTDCRGIIRPKVSRILIKFKKGRLNNQIQCLKIPLRLWISIYWLSNKELTCQWPLRGTWWSDQVHAISLCRHIQLTSAKLDSQIISIKVVELKPLWLSLKSMIYLTKMETRKSNGNKGTSWQTKLKLRKLQLHHLRTRLQCPMIIRTDRLSKINFKSHLIWQTWGAKQGKKTHNRQQFYSLKSVQCLYSLENCLKFLIRISISKQTNELKSIPWLYTDLQLF